VLSVVRSKNVVPSDDVTTLAAEIARLRADGMAAHEAADRFDTESRAAESFAEARALSEQAEAARWKADHCAARLPILEQRLFEAKGEVARAALAKHRRTIAAIYPKLREALEAAVTIQCDAMAAREAAARECGEGLVFAHIPAIGFRGLLLPEAVRTWPAENDRTWAQPWAAPALPTRPAPRPPLTRDDLDALKTRPLGDFSHRVNQIGAKPSSPVRPAPVAPTPAKPRPLHKAGRPGPGERRVTFVRPSVPISSDGTDLSRIGDILNLPEETALALLRNSAVTETP
jgi:hypothetical protein